MGLMEAPAGNGAPPSARPVRKVWRWLNSLTSGAALIAAGVVLVVLGQVDGEPTAPAPPPPTTPTSTPPPTPTVSHALDPMWEAIAVLEDVYGDSVTRDGLAAAALAGLAQATGQTLESAAAGVEVPDGVAPGFEEVWRLWHHIEATGDEVEPRQLVVRALEAMVGTTDDPNASVLLDARVEPDGYVQDAYHGIGAFVSPVEDYIVIGQPFPGGPASNAGIRPGDVLVEVNGVSVVGMPIDEVVALVRGPAGTSVHLLLERAGADPVEVEVVREEFLLGTARSSALPGGIGYLAITSLESRTPGEVAAELEHLMLRDTRALILDLRGNPGGSPGAALAVADMLLDEEVVYLEEGLEGESVSHQAQEGGRATELPLAILIDQGTVGEAELLAGALRYHRRGPLFGVPTAGRSALHQGRELGEGVVLVTRSGRWLLPSRETVEGRGLQPDQIVDLTPEDVGGGFDRPQATANAYLWTLLEGGLSDDEG